MPGGVTMEVMGVAIAVLGIILAYIWRANGQMKKYMEKVLENVTASQKEIAAGQKEIAHMISTGQKEIAQMLLNQTKILDKIETKIGTA
jgi:hypothetical protein